MTSSPGRAVRPTPLSPLSACLLWMVTGWPTPTEDGCIQLSVRWNADLSNGQVGVFVPVNWGAGRLPSLDSPPPAVRPDWLLDMPWIVQGLLAVPGCPVVRFDPGRPMAGPEQVAWMGSPDLATLRNELRARMRPGQREQRLTVQVPEAASAALLGHLPPAPGPLFAVMRNRHTASTCHSEFSVRTADRREIHAVQASSTTLSSLSVSDRFLMTYARFATQINADALPGQGVLHTAAAWPLTPGVAV